MVAGKIISETHAAKRKNMFELINKVLEVHSEFHPYSGTPKECASFIECNERHLYSAREILVRMGKMYKQRNKTKYKLMDYFVNFDKRKKLEGTDRIENLWSPITWEEFVDFLEDEAEKRRRMTAKGGKNVKPSTEELDFEIQEPHDENIQQKTNGVVLKSTFEHGGKISINVEIVVNKEELMYKSMVELVLEKLSRIGNEETPKT